MNAEEAPAVVRPSVRLSTMEPLKVLSACKRAASKAGVSLAWWEEFSATAWACLTPDCAPEELSLFMSVVNERFEVSTPNEKAP